MPFNISGIYTPPDGAENAFPGQVIASATWNAIFTDISTALTQMGRVVLAEPLALSAAGPFSITTETYIALIKGSPSATTMNLPAVATRSLQALRVVDWNGNAGDITFMPNGAETIEGLSSYVVASSGGPGFGAALTLIPATSFSGWAVLP